MDFTNHQFKQLQERIKELEEETDHLQKELSDALQDPFTKYKKKDPAESTAKRGAPIGHEGHSRSNPEVIDKTLDVYLDRCPICGSERISPCNHTTEHIQEDFEDGKLTTTCFVHCYYWCSDCKRVVHGWGENEIPNAFIGPDVRAKTSFMRHEIKSSYNDTRRTLECFGDLKLSNAALVGFDKHMTERGKPLYDALKQSLPDYRFMHADETGWKRDWLWVFTNPFITFFDIDESRGSQVVIDHLGAFYHGVLITDFWNAYRNKVGAFAKQKCLVHLLRDIKELLDAGLQKHPDAERFLLAVKELIQDAISLHGQHSVLSVEAYRSGRKDILKRFRELYRNAPLSHHESDNIRKRLIAFFIQQKTGGPLVIQALSHCSLIYNCQKIKFSGRYLLLLLEVLSRKVINMAVVVKMAGTSPELYSCIAPLVMNPEIIKYNHNYPFKTSESFVWFVASSEEQVVGFFPVEVRKKSAVINNYYVSNNDEDVFLSLLEAVINEFMGAEKVLEAVVQKPHESFFLAQGFEIERTWSLYLKMKKKYEEK